MQTSKQIKLFNAFHFDAKKFFLFKQIFKLSFIQLVNCKVSIIIFMIMALSQPLILFIIYFSNMSLLNYSLMFVLVPLGVSFVFIVVSAIRLFSENRFNYIDSILIVKPIKRHVILTSRALLILSLIFICLILHTLVAMVFLLVINETSLFLALFIANIFITPLLVLIILALIILISIKVKPTWFASTSLLLVILMSFTSLITRPLLPDNNMSITYSNPDISFAKLYLANDNQTYITTNAENPDYIYTEPSAYFGNTNIANYFIPSEWFVSFYSSFFTDFNYQNIDSYINTPYSLINHQFKETAFNDLNIQTDQTFMFLPNDIIPFNLSAIEYEKLIMDNLAAIMIAKNVIDFGQAFIVNRLLEKVQSTLLWNSPQLEESELNSLKLLLGVDHDYNQMYYLFKYYPTLINHLPNIKTLIIQTYHVELWNLMEYLWTSTNAKFNMNSADVLSSKLSITDVYADDKVTRDTKPILSYDKTFIQEDLIRYSGSQPQYLTTTGSYTTADLDAKLKAYDTSITDEIAWKAFVNNISLKLNDTRAFLNYINSEMPQIYQFSLANNYVNLYQYGNFLQVEQVPYLIISDILIALFTLSTPFLLWWTIRRFRAGQYNDI